MFMPHVKILDDRKVQIVNSEDNTYLITNTHTSQQCQGQSCVLHNPSEHHMRHMPLNFRSDTALFERTCEHGIGHPDPDSLAYFVRVGMDHMSVHGCDRCCAV